MNSIAIFGGLSVIAMIAAVLFSPASSLHRLLFSAAEPQGKSSAPAEDSGQPGSSASDLRIASDGDGVQRLVSQIDDPTAESPSEQEAEQEPNIRGDEAAPSVDDASSPITSQQIAEANRLEIRDLQKYDRLTDQRLLSLMDKLDRIDQQLGKLRLEISDLKQVEDDQESELRQLTRAQLELQEASLAFDQFVETELPELRRAMGTRRETAAKASSEERKTPPKSELGTLVLDNQTDREVDILVNGEQVQLKPGRNSFAVPIEDVRVEGEGKSWLLDAGLWQDYQGRKILYRDKWPL